MAETFKSRALRLLIVAVLFGQQVGNAEEDAHAEHKSKFIGTYILVMYDGRAKSQRNAVCEIRDNHVLLDEQVWGTWQAKNAKSMTIAPSNPANSEVVLLRKTPIALGGQERKGASAVKWSLEQVFVVSKWQHQAGNQQPIEMPLWSNGRVFKPDGRIKWRQLPATRELILEWPETTDRCKLSSDGNRYEGRNEHGTLITGEKIQ